ncbi:MAG: hypothetical protein KAH18_00235 [Psychromonas sp.]|nr:hypothetical protein [Psychromonas sp.]
MNPLVAAFNLLNGDAGKHIHPYLNEAYCVDKEYLKQLTDLISGDIKHPSKVWALVQKGDEVLDYRQAIQKYQLRSPATKEVNIVLLDLIGSYQILCNFFFLVNLGML